MDAQRVALARRFGLVFPEPFFWTTRRVERLKKRDRAYRSYFFFARALEVYSSPRWKIRVVAEGDSWFAHPCMTDWMPELGYEPYGCEAPGRTLATMVAEQQYLEYLGDDAVRAVVLSGGGNDLISWKKPSGRPSPIFKRGDGSQTPASYLNGTVRREALAELQRLLAAFAASVRKVRSELPIITHCYDWIEPRSNGRTAGAFGPWVGPQMDQVDVPKDQRLRNDIGRLLIDGANEAYRDACAAQAMTYVNLRDTVRGRWWDEIHPSDATAVGAAPPSLRCTTDSRARGPTGRRGFLKKAGPPAGLEATT